MVVVEWVGMVSRCVCVTCMCVRVRGWRIRTRERDNNINNTLKKGKIDHERMVIAVINRSASTQRLQLHEFIVIASFRQKLIVCARLAHFALLDEVTM